MRVDAIIQARMGSTRLPGKVLADIQGHPMLWHVLNRTRAAQTLNDVIVATTTKSSDDAIVNFCSKHNVSCFRGSETDVLDRYYHAASRHESEVIVRITSDCPLIDPQIIDKTVQALLNEKSDYASNSIVRTYPRGLDTEAMTATALQVAWAEAREPYHRAHVTPYVYENPGRFTISSVTADLDYSDYRWTVDTAEDLDLVRAIYKRFKERRFPWRDALELMEREPMLAEMNRSVAQKALQEG